MSTIIRSCSWNEDGSMVIEYMTPALDVRANGLVINHAMLVPPTDEFDELVQAVEVLLQRTLREVLATFEATSPMALAQVNEDEDEPSYYDNPAER